LFLDDVSARDAIADLRLAGFVASNIGVALSEEGKRARNRSRDATHVQPIPEGKHSAFWRLRHSIEHDIHSPGPGLSSREDASAAYEENPSYTEIDLVDTASGLGVAEDTIRLLDREIGPNGVLILVDAGTRATEVESMLEKNRGFLRTAMATERSRAAG
jgi:hypothetical protein